MLEWQTAHVTVTKSGQRHIADKLPHPESSFYFCCGLSVYYSRRGYWLCIVTDIYVQEIRSQGKRMILSQGGLAGSAVEDRKCGVRAQIRQNIDPSRPTAPILYLHLYHTLGSYFAEISVCISNLNIRMHIGLMAPRQGRNLRHFSSSAENVAQPEISVWIVGVRTNQPCSVV